MRLFLGLFLFIFSLCSSAPSEDGLTPALPELAVMTYNIHHGAGADGEIDIGRIARVILEAEPDLVALQEVDRFVERTLRADQAQQLANLTGMHMRFGFAINYQGGDFGNVILSRHPIVSFATHPLPAEIGEDRVLLHATIVIDSTGSAADTVSFFATHLDTFEKVREDAVPLILDRMPASPTHLHLLAGDLNALPESSIIASLKTRFVLPETTTWTYPADNPDRQIDYVMHIPHPSWRLDTVRVVPEPVASDHAPLLARFVLQN